jgi:hypothetical protein
MITSNEVFRDRFDCIDRPTPGVLAEDDPGGGRFVMVMPICDIGSMQSGP